VSGDKKGASKQKKTTLLGFGKARLNMRLKDDESLWFEFDDALDGRI